MNLPKFSTENTVLLTIVLVTVLALGAFSIARMPQEQFSEVPFFWVNVVVPFPGATAEDIERSVTIKVEQTMQGLKSLKQIQSVTSDGLSVTRVEFDDGISNDEFERLFQDVRTRVSQLDFPEGALQATANDFSSNDFLPVIEVVVSGGDSYEDLDRAARLIRDAVLGVRDVSDAELIGARDRRIFINADRERLESLGISITELLRAVQRHVRGVDVEHQFGRGLVMAGDELRGQHLVQRPGLLAGLGGVHGVGAVASHGFSDHVVQLQRGVSAFAGTPVPSGVS